MEKRNWNEDDSLQDLENKKGKDTADVARRILDWAKQNKLRIAWGEGTTMGSFFPVLDYKGENFWPIAVRSDGVLYIQFKWMKNRPVFNSDEKRLKMLGRINQIEGVALSQEDIHLLPNIPLQDPRLGQTK